MERKLSADVVTEDKVARISQALDRQKKVLDGLVLKGRRPELGPSTAQDGRPGGRASTRRRSTPMSAPARFSGLKRLEAKAVSSVTTPDSGYLVPPETEAEIGRRLAVVSPIRGIAGVRLVSSNSYRKPFSTTGFETGWVGETDARPETDTPTLVELEYPVMELYAMPAATAAMLDDTAIDIDQWIAGEVEQAFATQEGAAFVNGDADKKPKGFLNYTKVAEGSWAWGSIGYLITGVSGAFAASTAASDVLVDTIYTLKAGYRQNAHFVMNRKTQGADPQAEGRRRPLSLGAARDRRRPRHADELSRRGSGGHAGHRREQLLDRLRRFLARLPDRRPPGGARAARSLQPETLRAVLHDQAGGRRRAGFRRDQAGEVRHGVGA